jgi:hypothetical protein
MPGMCYSISFLVGELRTIVNITVVRFSLCVRTRRNFLSKNSAFYIYCQHELLDKRRTTRDF